MSIQSLSGQSCTGTFNLRNLLVDYCDELPLSTVMGQVFNFTTVIEREQGLRDVNQFGLEAIPGHADRINVNVLQGGNQLGTMTLKQKGDALEVVLCIQTPSRSAATH